MSRHVPPESHGTKRSYEDDGVEAWRTTKKTKSSARGTSESETQVSSDTTPTHAPKTDKSNDNVEDAMGSAEGYAACKDAPNTRASASSSTAVLTRNVHIFESTGDLFAARANSVLIHACNCQGSWGGGIAVEFKKHYPSAFKVYATLCEQRGGKLLGTCLLIPPQLDSSNEAERNKSHWIACLFTSKGGGRRKDKPESILKATNSSVQDLLAQIHEHENKSKSSSIAAGAKPSIKDIKMCRINSGLFSVPWEQSKEVIQSIEVPGGPWLVEVVSLPK